MGRNMKPLNERKMFFIQIKISQNEREIIEDYLSVKNIKNKSQWILDMVMEKIKEDKTIGLLGMKQIIETEKGKLIY